MDTTQRPEGGGHEYLYRADTMEDFHMPADIQRKGALPPPSPQALCRALNCSGIRLNWLAGDGSDRCYYRLWPSNREDSLVLMQLSGRDATALEKGGYEWIRMAAILKKNNIRIPKIITTLPESAAIVIEDYGNLMLEGTFSQDRALGEETLDRYKDGIDIVSDFLSITPNSSEVWCQRSFDQERFNWELNFLYEKYLQPIAGLNFDDRKMAAYREDMRAISVFLGGYSKYFVHRDYHSRNLMVKGNELAVIDFQDARLGPPAYDLVSLVFDSYVPLAQTTRLSLLEYGIAHISESVGEHVGREIKDSWVPTLLQRQLKAIGSFGFLTLEKNRGDYLKYVAPALGILRETKVFDERWPFLSGQLLDDIACYLAGR